MKSAGNWKAWEKGTIRRIYVAKDKYLEEGEAFLPKYRELLRATTVDTVENVAAIAGIDLTRPEFWRESLKTITDQIEMFIAETSK